MPELARPRVAITILNWQNAPDTIKCIESVMRLNYDNFRVIVVDNASSDGSPERILSWAGAASIRTSCLETDPRADDAMLTLIQTGGNLGYAGGNNAGVRHALASDETEYVWIINNDTTVEPDALGALVEALESDPSAGMAGSKLLCMDSPRIINAAGGGSVTPWLGNARLYGAGQEDQGQWDTQMDMDYLTGASLLVRRRVIDDIGLMDERYFLYWEDVDWCKRARSAGYRLVYCPASVVHHKEGGSTGGVSALSDYYWVRNGLLFTRRFHPYFLPFVLPAYLLKHTLIRTIRGLPLNFRVCLAGIRDYLSGRTGYFSPVD